MHPTRDNLIRVAMRLFAEKGFGSTSVADILKESGVHSGSLYHHFETKQSLLIGVLETYRDGIEAMLIRPAWDGVDDPIERIFSLLARYRKLLETTECLYGCPIGSLALELHEPDPPVRKLLAANFERWTDFVKACFDAAHDRLPGGLDTRQLAQFVLTTMEGGVMLSRTYRSLDAFDRSVKSLRDYLVRLTSAPPAPPS